jgi:hypothetical protein
MEVGCGVGIRTKSANPSENRGTDSPWDTATVGCAEVLTRKTPMVDWEVLEAGVL